MTKRQKLLFEKYQHIVPDKIRKYAPEFIDNEDFHQDVLVHLIEHIIANANTLEHCSKSEANARLHSSVSRYVISHYKNLIEDASVTCSYRDIAGVPDDFDILSIIRDPGEDFYEAMSKLDLNITEQIILARRFGFLGEPESLEVVGCVLGLSRERVRQIEKKAIRKLSHPRRRSRIAGSFK